MRGRLARFEPAMPAGVREERLRRWRKALAAA
jgi:glycerol kinase